MRSNLYSVKDSVPGLDIIEAYDSFSRYLDDLLNIDKFYLEGILINFIHLNRF